MKQHHRGPATAVVLTAALLLATQAQAARAPFEASKNAIALDSQINWRNVRLLVVQDGGRYKTLDSFARESFAAMTGAEYLPGLSPEASLFEWLFNRPAYDDTPVIRVKEPGLLVRLTEHLPERDRQRILEGKYFTPRELADPAIERALSRVETKPLMRKAANRVRLAQGFAENLDRLFALVPQPGGDAIAPWFTPEQVLANLSDAQLAQLGIARADLPPEAQSPVPGITPDQALEITVDWSSLRAAWRRGDAVGAQTYLDRLGGLLPTLAGPGIYPSRSQRQAEVQYYSFGKFTWGWAFYFLAFLFSIPALVTKWRWTFVVAVVWALAGLICHAYGLSLRWYILGRIPVANMFEAVVASTWIGIALALLLEYIFQTRVFLVAASATGFLSLVLGSYVLPGSELSSILGILDHLQLRIHTVLITTSYSLIAIAAIIGVVYLVGYYYVRATRPAPDLATAYTTTRARGSGVAALTPERPLLAGAAPGDEGRLLDLPQWLNNLDWSHLIILNMVFVMLFVGGVIMGAIWANESWGRPWGWDPKEVFALNTWIVYAILLHVRFVVRDRGLWTAWLSVAGCAMMAFNWGFVNFFINSIHSYA